MITWFKKLRKIVQDYNHDREYLIMRIAELEKILRDRTSLNVDIHHKGLNHVIMVGRYKNTDWIQTYTIDGKDFHHLVDQLKHMQRYGVVDRVDAPPQMSAAIRSSLGEW